MKVRARTNGNVVELDDVTAIELIDRGIYEPVVEPVPDAGAPLSLDPPPAPRKKGPR